MIRSFEHRLFVLFEPFLRGFRKDIPEGAFLIRDEFDHFCDHIVWIEPSFRLGQDLVHCPLHHCARGEIDLVVEPSIRRLDHCLIEACQIRPRIDRLYLNAERPHLVLHSFSDRLHGMLSGRVHANHRRTHHSEDR